MTQKVRSDLQSFFWRWIGAWAILIAEIAAVKVRYSTGSIQQSGSLGAWLILHSSYPLSLSISIAAATLFLGHELLWNEFAATCKQLRKTSQALPLFGIHLVLYAIFFYLSGSVFEGKPSSPSRQLFLVFVWAAMGFLTLLCWALSSMPASAWLKLITRCRGILVKGAALGSAAAIAGWGAQLLWTHLVKITFWAAGIFVRPIYSDFMCELSTFSVGTSRFMVSVAQRCSGQEGIGVVSVCLLMYFWFARKSLRFPPVLLLLPLGVATAMIANALRIASLITIGTSFSPAVALGGFHLYSGWIATIAVSIGMITVAERTPFFRRIENRAIPAASEINPAVAYLLPLLASLATELVSGALSSGFDYLYPIRVAAVGLALWIVRKGFEDIQWRLSGPAIMIGGAASIVWLTLARSGPAAALPMQISGMPALGASIWLLFRTVGYVIAAPAAEELAFRGYLTRRIISADFRGVPINRVAWLSLAVSSGLFAAVHGKNWLPGLLVGMLFFWAFRRRGRILDAIQAHVAANAFIAAYVFMTGDWAKWS